jgi:Tol biopolymer transport system component
MALPERTCPDCQMPPLSGEQSRNTWSEVPLELQGQLLELERIRSGLAGRYAVERAVGAGGTATVYLAEDLRHRRKVAIKVLSPEITSHVGSARFLHEIEIAARLQHPHVLPVYDSGEASPATGQGRPFLFFVMPYVEESLAHRLAQGPLPLGDAVRILSQVADALAFAHAQGVVHRDIKPDNVMLAGRHAMVADFGIAKALTVSLTDRPRTGPGAAIGTPYYMSPEQATGDSQVDGRADQYALGVVAYELLTGRLPFAGDSIAEILAAHMFGTPEHVNRLRPEVPPALAHVVMRCLEKEPRSRWQNTEELAEQVEAVAQLLATPPEAMLRIVAADQRRRRVRGLAIVALLAAAGLIVAGALLRSPAAPAGAPMLQQVSFSGAIGMSAISPDGRFLAYSSRDDGNLFIQELAGGAPLEIGRALTHVLTMRWSPDGSRLLAGGRYQGEPGVYLFPRSGGEPRLIRRARLAQWHPSGSKASVWDYPDKSMLTIDLVSGDSSRTALPGTYDWLLDVEWSPSGERLAYATMSEPDRYALRIVEADGTGARIVLVDTVPIGSPRWHPKEKALYYLSGRAELRKVRLHRSATGPKAGTVTLLDGMQSASGEVPGLITPFTITADARRLMYLKSLDYSNLWLLSGGTARVSRGASPARLTRGTAMRRGATLSPDMKWIAYLESSPEGTDLFRMPLAGGTPRRLTFSGRVSSRASAWSPDGTKLAFGIYDSGTIRLGVISADGGEVRMFPETSLPAMADVAWAPNGQILYQATGNRNFRLFDSTTGEQQWLVPTQDKGWTFAARPSPDGDHVALFWNRSPLAGVWVVSLRDTSRALLKEGRLDPIGWSPDGQSLLALEWDSGGIVRLGLDGRTEDLGALPLRVRNAECDSAERGRRRLLACIVPEQVSDVWAVDGFDPDR